MPKVRKISAVPRSTVVLLVVGLLMQLLWHWYRPPPEARARDLPPPPGLTALHVVSLGDQPVLAKLLMLWLQAFDNQPGISIPFRELDYTRVIGWLERMLVLDPDGEYPLLAAARLYGEVPVEEKQRAMLDFVHRQFLQKPNHRWRWLAHAVILAKHRLKDMPLAMAYARDLTTFATGPEVPFWARDMSIIVLEDMGELESARILIGGLLENGGINDPHEVRFLEKKLRELESQGVEFSTDR